VNDAISDTGKKTHLGLYGIEFRQYLTATGVDIRSRNCPDVEWRPFGVGPGPHDAQQGVEISAFNNEAGVNLGQIALAEQLGGGRKAHQRMWDIPIYAVFESAQIEILCAIVDVVMHSALLWPNV
jgi:hypothetical protein